MRGLYVLPGLVDIHIHAYAGADCMRGEDDVRRMSEGLLKTGVAAFMPTTMSAPIEATNRALRAIQAVRDMPCEKGADLRFDGGSGHAGRAIRPRRAGGIR